MTKTNKLNALAGNGDRGPFVFFRPILMHFAARFIGKTYAEFASDYRVLVEANIRCMETFDCDAVGLISDPYRETSAFGAKISYPLENVPVCEEKIIRSLEDVKNLKNPDVYKSERTLDRIKAAGEFRKLLGDHVPVIGWIEGPLAEACDLAGLSEMLVHLMTDADLTKRLLEKCKLTAKDFAKAQIDAGCDVIGMGDAICSQISGEQYNEHIAELHKEIIDYIHGLGGMVKLHICGNITHLLPYINEVKPDILDVDWMVDMDHAHNIFNDKIIRCGNINPVEIQNRNRDEVFRLTKDLVEKERGRKFILSGGCEITVDTPVENLQAMRCASIIQ